MTLCVVPSGIGRKRLSVIGFFRSLMAGIHRQKLPLWAGRCHRVGRYTNACPWLSKTFGSKQQFTKKGRLQRPRCAAKKI